jgi:hypothetical protein
MNQVTSNYGQEQEFETILDDNNISGIDLFVSHVTKEFTGYAYGRYNLKSVFEVRYEGKFKSIVSTHNTDNIELIDQWKDADADNDKKALNEIKCSIALDAISSVIADIEAFVSEVNQELA